MSDTPRTDAVQFTVWKAKPFDGSQDEVAPLSFARELERENAELRADVARLDWLTFTDDSGDFGSRRCPHTLSYSEQHGWTAYAANGKPRLDVPYFPTPRAAIDVAMLPTARR